MAKDKKKAKKDKKDKKSKKEQGATDAGGGSMGADVDALFDAVTEGLDVPEADELPKAEADSELGAATSESDEESAPQPSEQPRPEEAAPQKVAPPTDATPKKTTSPEVSEGLPPRQMPLLAGSAIARALAAAEANEAQVVEISDKYKFEVGDLDYNLAISKGEEAVKKIDPNEGKKLTASDLKGRNEAALTNMLPNFTGKDKILIQKRIDHLQKSQQRVETAISGFDKLISDQTLGEALRQMSQMESEINSLTKSNKDEEKLKEITAMFDGCKPLLQRVVLYRNTLWKGGGKDGTKSPKQRLFVLVKDLPEAGSCTLRYYDAKKFGKELGQISLAAAGAVTKTEFDPKTNRHTLELVAADKKHGARSFFFSHGDEAIRDDWYYNLKQIVGDTVQQAAEEEPAAQDDDDDDDDLE